jgi:hypothetical protein
MHSKKAHVHSINFFKSKERFGSIWERFRHFPWVHKPEIKARVWGLANVTVYKVHRAKVLAISWDNDQSSSLWPKSQSCVPVLPDAVLKLGIVPLLTNLGFRENWLHVLTYYKATVTIPHSELWRHRSRDSHILGRKRAYKPWLHSRLDLHSLVWAGHHSDKNLPSFRMVLAPQKLVHSVF